jgi:membrane protein YqaA with SNARE-associated domain
MTHDLLQTLGLYAGTLVVCFLAGLIPLINAEVYLVGISIWAIKRPEQLPAIIILAAVGQMLAKVILYYAGMGMFELPSGKWKERIDRARAKLTRWEKQPYLVYASSASLGLPPLYLTTFAAGAMRINFTLFCLIGLAGRLARFGVIVIIPFLANH